MKRGHCLLPHVLLIVLVLIFVVPACPSFNSNGQRIFMTTTSASGQQILPRGFQMPMFRLTCANCHRPDGHGGTINYMMYRYDVPNITWPELTSDTSDRPAYNEESLRTAITEGIGSDGDDLEYPMPQWQMASRDLDDLVAFIKTLN